MRVWLGVAFVLGGFVACSEEDTPPQDSSAAETTDTAEDTADLAEPDSEPLPATEPDSAPELPDTADRITFSAVHGIFTSKCGSCHGGFLPDDGSGFHAIGSFDPDVAYAASQRDATYFQCTGKKVGECALIRITNGSMPQGKGCGSNPNNAGCLSAAEKQLIQDWIRDGMLR